MMGKTASALLGLSLAAGLLAGSGTMAGAQDTGVNGRYVMSPTSEGFLKLDSRTGEVSECKRQASGFQCTLVADERTALQGEIDQLSRENASLRETLAKNGVTPPAASAPPAPGAATPGTPSDRDFEHAMDLMERFLRRFMSIVREEPKPPSQL
jgi:hypothetical protein